MFLKIFLQIIYGIGKIIIANKIMLLILTISSQVSNAYFSQVSGNGFKLQLKILKKIKTFEITYAEKNFVRTTIDN